MNTALTFALTLLDLVPLNARGVSGAFTAVQEGRQQLQKMIDEERDPTQEEWEALNSKIESLREQLHTDD